MIKNVDAIPQVPYVDGHEEVLNELRRIADKIRTLNYTAKQKSGLTNELLKIVDIVKKIQPTDISQTTTTRTTVQATTLPQRRSSLPLPGITQESPRSE